MQLAHGLCDMFWKKSGMVWCGLVWVGMGFMRLILSSKGSTDRLDTLKAHGNVPAKKQLMAGFMVLLFNVSRSADHRTKLQQMQEKT
ncbi:MAG: hypothetical protein HN861_00490 [Rhodospirillaceae bacterium]|jgi:hypothetical protein|nr:hypothetical protein [Rhodospirillaceae bacterium]MBT7231484.1 hypothetical protein [Rhodospirillaceae bacterium]